MASFLSVVCGRRQNRRLWILIDSNYSKKSGNVLGLLVFEIKLIRSFEVSATVYLSIRHNIPTDLNFYQYHYESVSLI